MKYKLLLIFSFFIFQLSQANAITVKVGVGGDYSTLKDAFYQINKGYLTGDVVIQLTSSTTETAVAKLTASGVYNPGGKSNYTSVTIYPVTTGITISGNFATANLIDLLGATNVTIDGRVYQAGAAASLTIVNTAATAATAVGLSAHASNNTVKFCVLKGYSATSRGVINIDNRIYTAGSAGCSNNVFSYNTFRGNSTGSPYFGIYSLGYPGDAATSKPAVVNTNNTASYNNFPEFLKIGNSSAGIKAGANNDSWTISGNSFYHEEGTFAATGSTWTTYAISISNGGGHVIEDNYIGGTAPLCGGVALSKSNTSDITFAGINLINTTGVATSVQGNIIKNIDWTNSAKAPLYGIFVETGATGDLNIGTSSPNIIGSNVGNNSINYTAAATGGNLYGIYVNSTGATNCKYNQIGSLTGNNTATFTTNISAIYMGSASGSSTVNYNIIGSSTTSNSINSTAASVSENVYGINIQNTATNSINNNVISNLTTGTTASGNVYGINLGGGTNTVNGNFIHSLDASANSSTSSSSAIINGIASTKGSNFVSNNIISIFTATGAIIYGLNEVSTATSTSFFHNTVSVSGVNPSVGAQKSYALYSAGTANIRDFRNNILVNTRTGGTGVKVAAAITANATGTLTVNYNNYIPAFTGGGANSVSTSPGFTLVGGTTVASYNTSANLTGVAGTNVLNDFADKTRSAIKMGALETAYVAPTLSTSVTNVAGFSYIVGSGPSATKSFTVSGSNLVHDIILSVTANYEISLNAISSFSSSVSIAPTSGSVSAVTIYVRLKNLLSDGTYNSDVISVQSSGTSSVQITCNGTISPIPPAISTSISTLSQFYYVLGNGPSASHSFSVDGTHLSAAIIVTPSANFEISESNATGFSSNPISITPLAGTVAAKVIYVRLKAGLAGGNINSENITVSTTGASNTNVSCNGVVGAGKVFTVTVPAGTKHVYITGNFSLKNWDITTPYELTRTANPNEFTGTFICDNTITYKYLNEIGDYDYQAAVSVGGVAESARTYKTNDVVAAWLNVKQVKLNVSFAPGTGVPNQLFVSGSWDNNIVPLELVKKGDIFSKTLGGYSGNKFSGSTTYKYYTNSKAAQNWEANANGSAKANRITSSTVMNDVIERFTTSVPAATTTDKWRVLPIRSQVEAARDSIGGEGEQLFHGFARCLNHPDYIYACHDVMGSWRSIDGGTTWNKNLDKGAWLPFTRSIEVDPVNPNIVFMSANHAAWYTHPTVNSKGEIIPEYGYPGTLLLDGLYRSVDGGTNWEQVLNAKFDESTRAMRQLIAYSKASMTTPNTSPTRWYSGFDYNALYRSDNSGNSGTWVKCGTIDTLISNVVPHPTLPDVVYVSTYGGLYKSTDAGVTLVPDPRFAGDRVTSVLINPQDPNKMYVVVYNEPMNEAFTAPNPLFANNGMYVSTDGGATFTLPVFMHPTIPNTNVTKECFYAYMNPGFPEQIYWVSGNTYGSLTQLTNDGGISWTDTIARSITFPGLGRETGYRRRITGKFASVLPNPKDKYAPAVATGSSTIVKIVDINKTTPQIIESSTGFTGNSSTAWSDGISFHPNNPDAMMFSCNDIGPRTSTTNGSWFHEPDPTLHKWWEQDQKIGKAGSYSADYQYSTGSTASSNVVASCGMYNEKSQLMHSKDMGVTWDSCVTVVPWKKVGTQIDSMAMRKNPITNVTSLQPVWDVDHYKQSFFFVGFDPEVGYENYCYSGTMMSTDGGYTFNHIKFPVESYSGTITTRNSESDVLPTVLGISKSPDGKSHIIALSAFKFSVWRSDDHGTTWYCIMPKRLIGNPSLKGMDRIVPFAVHPTDPNVFFCMNPNTRDLMKVVYNPANKTYIDVQLPIFGFFSADVPAAVKASNQIRFIAVDPVDPNYIYVSMSISGIPNVWRTTDGGSTWAPLEGITCHEGAMKVNPYTRELYRGSMAGVWIYGTPQTSLTTVQNTHIVSTKLRIFVNRSSNSLRIFGADDNERFTIYDLSGRILHQFIGESTSLKNLMSGAFILKSSHHQPIKFLK